MASNLPQNFPPAIPKALASYDMTTFAEGTGVVNFHCFLAEDSVSETEHMSNQVIGSSITSTAVLTGTSKTRNFDLSAFNRAVTVRGTATTTIPVYLNGSSTGVRSWTFTIRVIKLVGADETVLVTTTSKTNTQSNTAGEFYFYTIRSVIPRTRFKKGDILRLKATLTGVLNSGNQGQADWGHDPLNRDGTATWPLTPSTDSNQTTKMEFYCPFEVDL